MDLTNEPFIFFPNFFDWGLCVGKSVWKRFALPYSTVLIHQPLGGVQGQASDIAIHAKEILRVRENLYEVMAKHTGQTKEKIAADTNRDNFLTSMEAKAYGIIDEVITRKPVVKEHKE